jgi:hypothetical protein
MAVRRRHCLFTGGTRLYVLQPRDTSRYAPLLKDGDLKVKKDDGRDKLKDHYVFLFEGALIYTKALKVRREATHIPLCCSRSLLSFSP